MKLNGYNTIIVTGMSGSGKTTVSTKLSKQLKKKYVSLDDYVKKELYKEYTEDKWKLLPYLTKHKIFERLSVKVTLDYVSNNSLDNSIIEASFFLYPSLYKFLLEFTSSEINKLVLVDTPVNIIIERRTKREIEKKEKKLNRKLTKEEINKKYQNSKKVTNHYVPLLKKFKVALKDRYVVYK
jgi:adenylate kinase family enzyme